jgi:hypothetical protein
MSDAEVSILRREIKELSDKADKQYTASQRSQQEDRDTFREAIHAQQQTFSDAMDKQRDAFQSALNKQFMANVALDKKVDKHNMLLENIVGDGQPGQGRLGVLEAGMDIMKKFRWQALTVISLMMWGLEVWQHGR